ncbi:MAG: potassium channel family protein [Nanoarchaeota archaeon]
MKRFVSLDYLKRFNRKRFSTWIDKLGFTHILIIWVLIIIFFGLIYWVFQFNGSFLKYNAGGSVQSISDSIYFSFVTATTTGFGDITPSGVLKLLAVFEVLFGLLLLAVVTSKLVSIKQNYILEEIYELSFTDRVNRLRSSLLLFRQNIDRLISKIEEKSVIKRDLSHIPSQLSSFEDLLSEISSLITKTDTNTFAKNIDPVNAKLIFNSIMNSFEKIEELIEIMNVAGLEWKKDMTINLVTRCLTLNDELFLILNSSKLLKEDIKDLNSHKDEITKKLMNNISRNLQKT